MGVVWKREVPEGVSRALRIGPAPRGSNEADGLHHLALPRYLVADSSPKKFSPEYVMYKKPSSSLC